MRIDAIAATIEQNAGERWPGLRDSLAEMQGRPSGRSDTPEQLAVKAARERLGLSQSAFAQRIDTPFATQRDWEQGRFGPPGAERRLQAIGLHHHEAFLEGAG